MLVLIALAIGAFLWWRTRRARLRGLPRDGVDGGRAEEHIPLTESSAELDDLPPSRDERADGEGAGAFRGRGKGKERALGTEEAKEEIFRVDDSEDEDTKTPRTGGR